MEMEGDMMGGPFVSHARVDRANGRVIVAEAFIYSPDKMKRNLMRQMEVSLYTLRLPKWNAGTKWWSMPTSLKKRWIQLQKQNKIEQINNN